MAKTSASIEVPVGPGEAFALLTDPARFGEWLVFHDSWQGEAPARADLRKGATIATVVAAKEARVPLQWKIDAFDDPRDFRFIAKEKGVKVVIGFTVAPASAGSEIIFTLDLSGVPVFGPIGKKVVAELHDDVELSLEQFRALAA